MTLIIYLSLQNLLLYFYNMRFTCEVVLNELFVEDLTTSFAAQHGLSIASVRDCKQKLKEWDPGK